jgi:UDP-N-acetylglucosamine acyltransferase
MGAHNQFHAGCVIGDSPQDLKYTGDPTAVRIGDYNVFREHATVQRATKPDAETVIGSHNFIMVNSHVAHNCVVGNHVILANGALLAGHASAGDKAFISGNCLVHQYVRVGTLALMQGGSAVSKDLPPYTIARGDNHVCGLNVIGLRRAGLTPAERLELKQLYRQVFRSGRNIREAAQAAQGQFTSPAAKMMIEFVMSSKRGVCADVGSKISAEDEEHD